MKKRFFLSLLCWSFFLCLDVSAAARQVSPAEAEVVARNWIAAIVAHRGGWGDAGSARLDDIVEFSFRGRTVGYFCPVSPRGFIVVSAWRELAPVKAYSEKTKLDPQAEDGLAGLLKERMAAILNRLQEARAGGQAGWSEIAEIDYRPVWDALENDAEAFMGRSSPPEREQKTLPATDWRPEEEGEVTTMNYQEGETLLNSHWHQYPPYNNDCPWMDCDTTANGRVLVGCVATAGAQIMRYWNWPPYGIGAPYDDPYDWANMPDMAGTASPEMQQAAVAELSSEIGRAVKMEYGCDGSGAYTADMPDVYEEPYRYWYGVALKYRDDYSADGWFDLLKYEFDHNRPVQYRVPGHSIVGDGWQEIGSPAVRQYHMLYGWTYTSYDTWYTLDTLCADPEGEEFVVENILPAPYLATIAGDYPRLTFPYRYFYMNVSGSTATFEGGQYLQFLPGIVISAAPGETITFQGSASSATYLFTRGDAGRGIRMAGDGTVAVKMYGYGGIRFH